jgi:tryptophan-rich sensory protein
MALGEILVLWGVLAWMQVRFWGLDAVAGWLWLPYLLWVTFACALNMATWKLNS